LKGCIEWLGEPVKQNKLMCLILVIALRFFASIFVFAKANALGYLGERTSKNKSQNLRKG
jgi:hypothetical protein